MLLWFDYQTSARSTFVALFVFAVFALFDAVHKKNICISPNVSWFVLWSPLLLALGYLLLFETGFVEKYFSFMDFGEGKALDARLEIWGRALKAFSEHPLLGAYYEISDGTGMSQLHNTHLDTLVSYGLLPFVLFMTLICRGVRKILPYADTSLSKISLFAFYTIILQGTFEAALVSGGVGLYIMSFGFLLLAKYRDVS
jgi:O-antigen ligase